MGANNPTKSNTLKKKVLGYYKDNWLNVSMACKQAGIDRTTFYEWKKEDQEFADRVEEIYQELIEMGESKLYSEAIFRGNTTALIFFLKSHKPEVYREILRHEGEIGLKHSGLEHLSDEELEKRIKSAQKRISDSAGGEVQENPSG